MYAPAHTALALAGKRTTPDASLIGLMLAAQGSEIAWVALSYAGIEHQTVDTAGHLHLEYLPYSHSLLTGLGGGLLLWALMRILGRRPAVAAVMGLAFASHILLDILQHEPNIRLLPWLAHPTVGLNLASRPWLDFTLETALSVACWAYYRGSWKLLAGLIGLNLGTLPFMLGGEQHAQALAHNHLILPTTIATQMLIAFLAVWAATRRDPAPAAPAAAHPTTAADAALPEVAAR